MMDSNSDEMLVSFVLPAYKASYLRQAIDSILWQDYRNIELIIVNDKSPENLDAIVAEYSDNRIRYYKNKENIGGRSLVAQWNQCIQYAKGEFLVLASDDDWYNVSFTSECVKLVNKYPYVDLVRSSVKIINENNKLIGIDAIIPEFISKYGYLYYYMNGLSFTCIGNFFFRSSVIKEKGFIDYPCAFGSDVSSTIMMAENGCANTNDMLFNFRISNIHLSSSKDVSILEKKLKAITLLFEFIMSLHYDFPQNSLDRFYYESFTDKEIRAKMVYDYYNMVIKYLPITKLYYIQKCSRTKR